MTARIIVLLVAAMTLLAGACDRDGSVLTAIETGDDPPPTAAGGGPSSPPNPAGGGPPEPTFCAPVEVDGLCECPPFSACICAVEFASCDMFCDQGCAMECSAGAQFCGFSCGFGCQMVCPQGTICSATCEGDCTLICLPGSVCDLTSVAGVSQINCDLGASCTCNLNCDCVGEGCEAIEPMP